MKPTWIKVQVVANRYTVTMGNLWGATSRVVSPWGGREGAIEHGRRTAELNNINGFYLTVGRGKMTWQEVK
jgi:hypothetical protein